MESKEYLIKILLEEYPISEVFERMDLTEEFIIEYLLDTGVIKWDELTNAMPLPVH